MASPGAMAEFGRMPASRKVLAFAMIGGVLGLAYWTLGYKPLGEELAAAQAEHETSVRTNKRLGDDLSKYEDLQTHLSKLRELIEKNQVALPSEAELPAFFETLQHRVAESGVEILKWSRTGEEPVESFVRMPVKVEMTGTFMQIKRFFASLVERDLQRPQRRDGERPERPERPEQPERIVSIEDLALTSPTVTDRETILTATFTVVMFRQEDKPEVPDKPGGQPAAASSARPRSPTPATPAPAMSSPPLPGAATPAGKRARAENPLDQGDARNRKAERAGETKLPAAGTDRLQGGH